MSRSKTILSLLSCLVIILVDQSCVPRKDKAKLDADNSNLTTEGQVCSCFSSENGYWSNPGVFGNVYVTRTNRGNFFKRIELSDSLYILSVGRGNIEYILDSFACIPYRSDPNIFFENEEWVAIHSKGGSGVWLDRFYYLLSPRPIFQAQINYLDTLSMRAVEINIDKKSYFNIYFLDFNDTIKVPIQIHTSRSGDIKNIRLDSYKLTYSVETDSGLVHDTISNILDFVED